MLCKQSFGNFRPEVPKVNTKSVASCLFDVLQRLYHVNLTLHDADRTFVDVLLAVFGLVGLHQSLSPVNGKGLRETVAAHCHDTDLDFG